MPLPPPNSNANRTQASVAVTVKNRLSQRLNFLLAIAIALTLFFLAYRFPVRLDLTRNKTYTLSDTSKILVEQLREPLRVKIFLSKNIPPPLNDLETSLRDLMNEYAEVGGNNFRYTFYPISTKEGEASSEMKRNEQLAQNYGIYPQSLQTFEADQMKLVKITMGMVIEYGELLEKVPVLSDLSALEYQLTSFLKRMSDKSSTLLALKEKIPVTLYLPENFVRVSPFFNITALVSAAGKIERAVYELGLKNYDQLAFKHEKTLDRNTLNKLKEQQIRVYPWSQFTQNGTTYEAGEGVAALTVEKAGRVEFIELLLPEVSLQLGQGGLQQVVNYQLANLDLLPERIEAALDNLLEVSDRIAYLTEKNTLSISAPPPTPLNPMAPGNNAPGANFSKMVSASYTLTPVGLAQLSTKEKSLIIAGPKENFSEFELFQIDQYLMAGGNLIVFLDRFEEKAGAPSGFGGAPPTWQLLNTGLEKLLAHYGVGVEKSYVLDKNSYLSRQRDQTGQLQEQQIYFAPLIKKENINQALSFLNNLNQFIVISASPVTFKAPAGSDTTGSELFASSKEAWLMKEPVNLLPYAIQVPAEASDFGRHSLAYLVEGRFKSYFADKPIPVKEETGETKEEKRETLTEAAGKQLETKNLKLEKSPRVKILVVGSSYLLQNNLVDQEGKSPNSVLLLNLLDAVNDREDWALMRSKGLRVNPLEAYDPQAGLLTRLFTHRQFLKLLNMAGLPLLVLMGGGVAYWRRQQRKKKILAQFSLPTKN